MLQLQVGAAAGSAALFMRSLAATPLQVEGGGEMERATLVLHRIRVVWPECLLASALPYGGAGGARRELAGALGRAADGAPQGAANGILLDLGLSSMQVGPAPDTRPRALRDASPLLCGEWQP